MVPHCGFDLHFSDNEWCWASFHVVFSHLYDSILKSRDITLPTKVCIVKALVFPEVMYGCESWTIKKTERWRIWCFQNVMLEKTLESSLDCKEIKPVHPKGNQHWMFIGRTDAKAEALILWSPDVKGQLIAKDPDAGKDWRQKYKDQQRMRWLDNAWHSISHQ